MKNNNNRCLYNKAILSLVTIAKYRSYFQKLVNSNKATKKKKENSLEKLL